MISVLTEVIARTSHFGSTVLTLSHCAKTPLANSLRTLYSRQLNRVAMTDAFSEGVKKLAEKCNSFLQEGSSRKDCIGFFIEGAQVGIIKPDFVLKVKQFPDVFEVVEKDSSGKESSRPVGVHLSQSLMTPEERTTAVNTIMEKLRDKDDLVALRWWYDEKYRVSTSFSSKPLMQLERAAAPLFGIVTYGTHINGYTFNDSGEMLMWIGKRAKNKPTYPGMYDNLSAGGMGNMLDVLACAWKECQEEASIDDDLLEDLKSVGMISYCMENARGVKPGCEFIFDLELPQEFVPVNADGEVESFQLLPIKRVKELIIQEDFKPNCAFIILDFLIRHGLLTPDTDPSYCYIMEQTHTPIRRLFSPSGL